MKTWHFYALATGLIDPGRRFTGDAADAPLHAPPGHAPLADVLDAEAQRVDLASGELVDYQPPAPPDTEWETWHWHADIKRWLPVQTPAAQARDARLERDRRLAACDWVVARATELGEPVPAPWAAYRQALRDLPEQPGFPEAISWPVPPA